VVLDTNVLVSGLAYPGSVPGRIISLWRQGGLDVVLSRYILDELTRVLRDCPGYNPTPILGYHLKTGHPCKSSVKRKRKTLIRGYDCAKVGGICWKPRGVDACGVNEKCLASFFLHL